MNRYYHCKTQEEYDWLMEKLKGNGYRWINGESLTTKNYFTKYYGKTVIMVGEVGRTIEFSSTTYFLSKERKKQDDFELVSDLINAEIRKKLIHVLDELIQARQTFEILKDEIAKVKNRNRKRGKK